MAGKRRPGTPKITQKTKRITVNLLSRKHPRKGHPRTDLSRCHKVWFRTRRATIFTIRTDPEMLPKVTKMSPNIDPKSHKRPSREDLEKQQTNNTQEVTTSCPRAPLKWTPNYQQSIKNPPRWPSGCWGGGSWAPPWKKNNVGTNNYLNQLNVKRKMHGISSLPSSSASWYF